MIPSATHHRTAAAGDLTALDRHGDDDVAPGMVDFAVNVRGRTPGWMLNALAARLPDLAGYPLRDDHDAAVDAIAQAHRRDRREVLPLAGAAEGFALLARLRPRTAVVIAPTFTEPERVLTSAGVQVTRVVCPEPWDVAAADVPDDADMVIVGNPTNPTSVLHTREAIESLRRPGRIVVVDEAFADVTLTVRAGEEIDEPESLVGIAHPDVIVIRSITKTFALAGLRAGYLCATADVITDLTAGRPHWPVGTLQLTALRAALSDRGRAHARAQARIVRADREAMCAALTDAGIDVCGTPAASFVLVRTIDGTARKNHLARAGHAVRSCANFAGLGPDHLRLAVREPHVVAGLIAAWRGGDDADQHLDTPGTDIDDGN
ncbi:Rv2231c family pyridoxal phosphate-dependent protein CobC [Williamsia herbipolensis]|uniref:Rv2231c family pyridoxal phosphate-dependent protein CobC n=1 Tax=Williamsia herbipolensis TaxID=1603258 RepID=UPI0008258719|nr:Rv2231c family pyridoxal phosphate-dependent protein CobC [Williamsia herbipolensis]